MTTQYIAARLAVNTVFNVPEAHDVAYGARAVIDGDGAIHTTALHAQVKVCRWSATAFPERVSADIALTTSAAYCVRIFRVANQENSLYQGKDAPR